jgi:hypothetical protein
VDGGEVDEFSKDGSAEGVGRPDSPSGVLSVIDEFSKDGSAEGVGRPDSPSGVLSVIDSMTMSAPLPE